MVDVFEQVEEELRSDRYKRLARTWLPIAGVVLVVALIGSSVGHLVTGLAGSVAVIVGRWLHADASKAPESRTAIRAWLRPATRHMENILRSPFRMI